MDRPDLDRRDIGVILAGILTGVLVVFAFTGLPGGGGSDTFQPPSDGTTRPGVNDTTDSGTTYQNISLGDAPGEPVETYITAAYAEDYPQAYDQLAPAVQDETPFSSWQQQIEEDRRQAEEENQTYTFQRIEEILPTSETAADVRFSLQIQTAGAPATTTDTVAVTAVEEGEWRLREAFSPYP